jgi:hypothetical protein
MFNICFLNKNNIYFENNINDRSKIKLHTLLNGLTSFKETTIDEMCGYIGYVINKENTYRITTINCYEDHEYLCQMCYVDWDIRNVTYFHENLNRVANYMSNNKEPIIGDVALIFYKINNTNGNKEKPTFEPVSITLDILTEMLYSKLIHTYIHVNISDDVNKITTKSYIKEEDIPYKNTLSCDFDNVYILVKCDGDDINGKSVNDIIVGNVESVVDYSIYIKFKDEHFVRDMYVNVNSNSYDYIYKLLVRNITHVSNRYCSEVENNFHYIAMCETS